MAVVWGTDYTNHDLKWGDLKIKKIKAQSVKSGHILVLRNGMFVKPLCPAKGRARLVQENHRIAYAQLGLPTNDDLENEWYLFPMGYELHCLDIKQVGHNGWNLPKEIADHIVWLNHP